MFSLPLLIPAIPAAVAAYLLGSLSAAILVCRVMRLPDPRTVGSNNPGATNVLRVGGKLPAALALLGDGLKGFLPVFVASMFFEHQPTIALVGLAAFLGHIYPVFFDFRGGKGVATALGVLLGADLTIGALALLTWLATSLTFRRSSLAALVTFVLVPLFFLVKGESVFACAFVIICVILFWTHRSNVSRLIAGEEPMIGKK